MMKIIVFFSVFMFAGIPAEPQVGAMMVHDPVMLAEGMAQTKAMLSAVSLQIRTLEQMYKDAERDIKMITQLPAKIYNTTVGFVEDQIAAVEQIGRDIESLVMTVEDSFVDADDIFMTDEKFDRWFDPTLTAAQRDEFINKDIERSLWIKKITRDAVMESLDNANILEKQIKDSRERILKMAEHLKDDDSLIAQMQAANALAIEGIISMHELAKIMAEMNKNAAVQNYKESTKEVEPPSKLILERECLAGEYRDPISFECEPLPTKSVRGTFEEGMEEDIKDTSWWKQQQKILDRKRSEER